MYHIVKSLSLCAVICMFRFFFLFVEFLFYIVDPFSADSGNVQNNFRTVKKGTID